MGRRRWPGTFRHPAIVPWWSTGEGQRSARVGHPAAVEPVAPILALRTRDCGSPGIELRLGSDDAPGNELSPGIELADGRLGADGVDGRLGSEGVVGRLDVDGRPGTDGTLGSEGVVGADGALGSEGRPGADVGSPEGAVTQAVMPLPVDALTDPEPAGEVTPPPPAAVTGLGIEGTAGVLTNCEPEGNECGTGSAVRLGTDVGASAL
jgi:Collagen triple helix repeat (20 copies)